MPSEEEKAVEIVNFDSKGGSKFRLKFKFTSILWKEEVINFSKILRSTRSEKKVTISAHLLIQ